MAGFLNSAGVTILISELTSKYDARYAAIDHSHDLASASAPGFMSAAQFTKLNGLSNYSLPKATTTALGGIKIGYTATGKKYAIELDTDGKAFVEVPWTDTQLGTNYTTSGKNYAVQKDASGNAYVNVPWTDNNTTYSNGVGLSLTGTVFALKTASDTEVGGIKTGYTTANKKYAVQVDTDGKAFVDVPWTDTVYTLPATAVTSVTASGTAPITLTGSIANNKLTLSASISAASATVAGSMSSAHYSKLEAIAAGATADSALTEAEIKAAVTAAFAA